MSKIILVVEDYIDTRDLMKFLLEGCGYTVREAADGQEAIDSVKKQFPDLILKIVQKPFSEMSEPKKELLR